MKYDLEKIKCIIKDEIENKSSMRSISKKLNMSFSTFKSIALKLDLYVPNNGIFEFKETSSRLTKLERILNNEVFYSTYKLKIRLIEEGLKEEICEECGLRNLWNGKKLNHHLDHKDGNKFNNNLENLKILCPNCHTQTSTYAGKNKKLKNIQNGHIYKKHKYDITERKKHFDDIKKTWEDQQKEFVSLILNSKIDFSKFGWVNKVSKIIKQKPQKVNKWMKRMMSDFYDINCYKRNNKNLFS